MLNLAAAAAVFVLFHLLVSGTRVRGMIIARVGEPAFMIGFSVLSLVGIVWLAQAYGSARTDPGNLVWWTANGVTRPIAWAVQLLAFVLIVAGLLTPNPTSVKQEGALERPDVVRGMLRITRHPFLWGVAIWAAGHLLVNGDLASVLLFGSLFVLGAYGGASIDAKRIASHGEAYHAFKTVTSNVPFVAILQGRQPLRLGGLGWRLAVAGLVYIAAFGLHPWFAGVSPTG